jgi:hypothetical protein
MRKPESASRPRSGRHVTPRLKVPGTAEQRAAWASAAGLAGVPVSEWLASVADDAARRALVGLGTQLVQAKAKSGKNPT